MSRSMAITFHVSKLVWVAMTGRRPAMQRAACPANETGLSIKIRWSDEERGPTMGGKTWRHVFFFGLAYVLSVSVLALAQDAVVRATQRRESGIDGVSPFRIGYSALGSCQWGVTPCASGETIAENAHRRTWWPPRPMRARYTPLPSRPRRWTLGSHKVRVCRQPKAAYA
jgi:hypothetical protein